VADFNYIPTYTSNVDSIYRIKEAKFGDGYAQRVADGINSIVRQWNLEFEKISIANATSIKNFINSKLGSITFTWDTPDSETVKVICKSMKERFRGPTTRDISLVFEEDFSQ